MSVNELTTTTPPDRVIRNLYEGFLAGDLDVLDAALADDVVFHVPGRGINTGTYRGKAAVLDFFASATDLTGGSLRLELHDVAVGDAHAVAIATYRAARPGRPPLENHLAHVMTVDAGRVTESWFHSRDQYDVDAFWS